METYAWRTHGPLMQMVRSVGKELPREVAVRALSHEDVVLDADAARRNEPVHERPVEGVPVRPRAVWVEQHRNEVEPRLDREDHALLDDARRPEGRVAVGRRCDRAFAVDLAARDVVHLNAEEVAEAVRQERG